MGKGWTLGEYEGGTGGETFPEIPIWAKATVEDNSSAQQAGLNPGMVIIRVGQIEVNSINVIDEAIKSATKQKRKALLLLVKVENGTRFVAIELK